MADDTPTQIPGDHRLDADRTRSGRTRLGMALLGTLLAMGIGLGVGLVLVRALKDDPTTVAATDGDNTRTDSASSDDSDDSEGDGSEDPEPAVEPSVERVGPSQVDITFGHPTWGRVTMAVTETESNGPVSMVVTDDDGTERWRYDNDGMYTFNPTGYQSSSSEEYSQSDRVIDDSGNIFIIYDPGRLDGVIALTPTEDGFEDWGSLPPSDGYDGRWYSAFVDDLDGDGTNEVVLDLNECDPGCGNSTRYTTTVFRWDGSGYSADEPQTSSNPTSYSAG